MIELKDVSKTFTLHNQGSAVIEVIKDLSLSVAKGECVALTGVSGAGKSTLIKGIAGIHTFNEGEIYFEGQQVTINNPKDSARLGIEVVYQDLALADNLDVVANMFLGREKMNGFTLDEAGMEGDTLKTLDSLSVTTIRSVRQPCWISPMNCSSSCM